jgi:hypothetical protein
MNDFMRCLLIDLKKKRHGEEVPRYYLNDFELAKFKSKLNSIEFLEAIRKNVLKNSDKNKFYMIFSIIRLNEHHFIIKYTDMYDNPVCLVDQYCDEDDFDELVAKYTKEIMIKFKELGFKRNCKFYKGFQDEQDVTFSLKFWIDESKKYL